MSALTVMCCPGNTLIRMVDLPLLSDFLPQTDQRDEKRPATLLHLLLLDLPVTFVPPQQSPPHPT